MGGREPVPPPDVPPAAPAETAVGEDTAGNAAPEVQLHPTGAARQKAAAARQKAERAARAGQPARPARNASAGRTGTAARGSASRQPAAHTKPKNRRAGRGEPAGSRAAFLAAAAALLIGLLCRAAAMDLVPFL